jgi:dTDP-4-amino-4,6-dideoxygalactose transaminase
MINNKNIHYVSLVDQWQSEKDELLPIIEKVLSLGHYVNGIDIDDFEEQVSKFCGVKYAIALNSGTDALTFALALSGIRHGDEVITTPNSFIATAAAIVHLGAKPVFIDVNEDQNINVDLIEAAITENTKAILPVHLTGRMSDMDSIMKISKKYNLTVIEDSAQAIGSKFRSKLSGSYGKVGCFSTHPLKNLNACGDGGFLTTNDPIIYEKAGFLRSHGLVSREQSNHFGYVSRMDSIQAAILNYRLTKLDHVISKRRENAQYYFDNLDSTDIKLPVEKDGEFNTYHTFVIQLEQRDKLKDYLKEKNITTAIHYPIPIHLQPAASQLGYKEGDFPITEKQSKEILTLPIHQYLTNPDLRFVVSQVNAFFN